MNSILGQLAVVLAGIIFVVALLLGLSHGVPLLAAILRAAAVMCFSAMVIAVFFRYFTGVLYRFIAERMQQQMKAQAPDEKGKEKTSPNSPAI